MLPPQVQQAARGLRQTLGPCRGRQGGAWRQELCQGIETGMEQEAYRIGEQPSMLRRPKIFSQSRTDMFGLDAPWLYSDPAAGAVQGAGAGAGVQKEACVAEEEQDQPEDPSGR